MILAHSLSFFRSLLRLVEIEHFNHPIRQVYEHYDCNTGQKMWDPLTVIHAVEGNDLFTLSQPGIVTLTPQAETIFTADPNGNSRYQIPGTAEWNEMMLEKIRKSGERF